MAGASGGFLFELETLLQAGYEMYHRGLKSDEFDPDLFNRLCCGNKDLEGLKFAFHRRVYLTWQLCPSLPSMGNGTTGLPLTLDIRLGDSRARWRIVSLS